MVIDCYLINWVKSVIINYIDWLTEFSIRITFGYLFLLRISEKKIIIKKIHRKNNIIMYWNQGLHSHLSLNSLSMSECKSQHSYVFIVCILKFFIHSKIHQLIQNMKAMVCFIFGQIHYIRRYGCLRINQ